MANWREKIELNKSIGQANEEFDLSRHEEPVPEKVKDLLCDEIGKSMFLSGYSRRIRDCKTIAELNRILANVFDEADRNLVWCGMFS